MQARVVQAQMDAKVELQRALDKQRHAMIEEGTAKVAAIERQLAEMQATLSRPHLSHSLQSTSLFSHPLAPSHARMPLM